MCSKTRPTRLRKAIFSDPEVAGDNALDQAANAQAQEGE